MANETNAALKQRNYVGSAEFARYVMLDMSASMNISNMDGRFLDQLLGIPYKIRPYIEWFIVGPWDVLNDVLFAHMVDRTRTRWGKFKPYLTLTLFAGVPIMLFYYSLSVIFWGTPPMHMPKIVGFVLFKVLKDLVDTFNGTARDGVLATITPDALERSRITKNTQWMSSILGEGVPQYIIQFLIAQSDKRADQGVPLEVINLTDRNLILVFGTTLTLIAGIFAIIFAIKYKERVQQSVEIPKLRMNLNAIIHNRPLLLMMLSDFFGIFTLKGDFERLYYDTVLKDPFMQTVFGAPGSILGWFPYFPKLWTWLRTRFSTKQLWIISEHTMAFVRIPTALVGLIGDIYLSKWKIFPVIALQEACFTPALTIRGVMQKEMRNELMDYTEWKTGFRNEAMTGAMKGLVAKICNYFFKGISDFILAKLGIRVGDFYLDQSKENKRNIFLLWLLMPGLTGGILSLIPKLFYNISKEDREQMYAELAVRRAQVRADADEVEQTVG